MNEPIHILSLGAGVQSSTLALMAANRQLSDVPVAAIFADTQAEPEAVYDWMQFLCGCEVKYRTKPDGSVVAYIDPGIYRGGAVGCVIEVHVVTKGNLEDEILKKRINRKTGKPYYSTFIPAFVVSGNSRGILRRKCTHDFKILELVKEQRKLIGKPKMTAWRSKHKSALKLIREWKVACALARKSKLPLPDRPNAAWQECQQDALAVVWIGISTDEAGRMKDSTVPWAVSRWPLIELGFNRRACELWLKKNGFDEAPKSACRWCPYHDDHQWANQRDNAPAEFVKSVAFEKEFQRICADGGAKNKPFLHDSLKPLDQVIFDTKPKQEHADLFNNECEGICGV